MNNLDTILLQLMCTGLGQGNTNTEKLTQLVLKDHPEEDHNQVKIQVVETLRNLVDRGEIQIVTINWELGEEFLYVCSTTL